MFSQKNLAKLLLRLYISTWICTFYYDIIIIFYYFVKFAGKYLSIANYTLVRVFVTISLLT